MTNKLVACLLILIVSASNISCARATTESPKKSELDSDGMPVGLDPRLKKLALQHRESIKRIDQSYDERGRGHRFFQEGNYKQALAHYLKAYEIAVGPKGGEGFLITETYEQLGQFDEAMVMLDEIITKPHVNDEGAKEAQALKSRLAKAQEQMTPDLIEQMLNAHELSQPGLYDFNDALARYKAAEAAYQKLLKDLEGRVAAQATIHLALLRFYSVSEDYNRAEAECRWLIANGDDYSKSKAEANLKGIYWDKFDRAYAQSEAYAKLGNYRQAIEVLQSFVDGNSSDESVNGKAKIWIDIYRQKADLSEAA